MDVKIKFDPRPHQEVAFAKRKRFSVLVWHRRSGKTVFSVVLLILKALACKKKSGRFAYVAPFYGQAKAVAWSYLKGYAAAIPHVEFRESELTVVFPNGATVRLYGADNPDSLRGLYFDGVVLDEVADMRPQMWGEIIRPALTDRDGWALFIGTPKGLNLFSDLYFAAIKDPSWFADLKRADETDSIPKSEIEAARRDMSAPQFAQEFDCDFAAAVSNAIIPLDLARAAYGKKLTAHEYAHAPRILGVDVARFGDDRSSMILRQGLAVFKPTIMRGLNTMELASRVAHESDTQNPDAVFIDEIGIGAGVLDRLRQLGRREVLGVNSGAKPTNPKYLNLRAEMWDKAAQFLREGGCLPECQELLTDLCAPTYSFNSAQRMVLESVEHMKERGLQSPDVASALVFTFAAPVQKRSAVDPFGIRRSDDRVETDYDVLAMR